MPYISKDGKVWQDKPKRIIVRTDTGTNSVYVGNLSDEELNLRFRITYQAQPPESILK
jgi:hypothetical protein